MMKMMKSVKNLMVPDGPQLRPLLPEPVDVLHFARHDSQFNVTSLFAIDAELKPKLNPQERPELKIILKPQDKTAVGSSCTSFALGAPSRCRRRGAAEPSYLKPPENNDVDINDVRELKLKLYSFRRSSSPSRLSPFCVGVRTLEAR